MERRDVVIVGAGPAGACAALALLAAGHRVRLFERHEEIVSSPCGEAIPQIALAMLEAATGFDSSPYVRHLPEHGRLVFPDGRHVVLLRGMAVLDRTAWQRAMVDQVRELGGEVQLGVRVERILPASSEVVLSRGRRQLFDRCLDASGPRSRLLPVPDRLACTQLTVDGDQPPDGDLWFLLDKRFSPHGAWLFPRGTGYHLGLVGTARSLRRLRRHLGLEGRRGTLRAAPIPVGGTCCTHGPVLALGDAAGMAAAVHGGGLFPIIASLQPLVAAVATGDLESYQTAVTAVSDLRAQSASVAALRSFTNRELDRLADGLAGCDLSSPEGPPADALAALATMGSLGHRFTVFLRGFVGPTAPSLEAAVASSEQLAFQA
jgi:flavin-dependent dehydrogenase